MSALRPAGFFIMRSPLLPWSAADRWSTELEAPSLALKGESLGGALERDATVLHERLRKILRAPEVRAAISVASPSLDARLDRWLAGDVEAASSIEPVLVRYFMRMAGRATPFGLFAGYSLGRVGAETQLCVPPLASHTRHTHVNLDCLYAVADRLAGQSAIQQGTRYHPNGSTYEVGSRIRYFKRGLKKNLRTYRVCEAPSSPHVQTALHAAKDGATIREIAECVVARSEGIDVDEAIDFVQRLVSAQLLFPDLHPASTGDEPLERLAAQLSDAGAGGSAAEVFRSVREDLRGVDSAGLNATSRVQEQIGEKLSALGGEIDTANLLRVDLRKPGTAIALGSDVTREVIAGVELLLKVVAVEDGPLDRFAAEFQERYNGREIPLLEALDAETGIGFDTTASVGSDINPLLDGIPLSPAPTTRVPWTKREEFLQTRLMHAVRDGMFEIALNDADVEALSGGPRPPLAAGFSVMASIAARATSDFSRGDYRVFLQSVGGTNSGALFGRFLQDDPELARLVRDSLCEEEREDPSAIHAEIAHLPPTLVSNALSRPLLREYEIAVVGGSGAPRDRQIQLDDLLVSVHGGRIELRSRTHGRRVIPHLTNAHAFRMGGLAVYRFLAHLQSQGLSSSLGWSWGRALSNAPFVPRVTRGKLVLSLARWSVRGSRFAAIHALSGAARFHAVLALRTELRLPRHVRLVDGDNTLPVDLDNVLSIESMLGIAGKKPWAVLSEMFPCPEELIARRGDEVFHHELVIPFLRGEDEAAPRPRLESVKSVEPTPDRARWPGEEWLYVKLYGGVATLDRVLSDLVGPLVRDLRAEGSIDRWFFIRYGDPKWHLRLRFRGNPHVLWSVVAPRLLSDAARWREAVPTCVIDTYDPEVERYGGEEAIGIAERIFDIDSDAALTLVRTHRIDADARWKLALFGMDRMLNTLGFSLEEKRLIVAAARSGQAGAFASGTELSRSLSERYRALRSEIDQLLVGLPSKYSSAAEGLTRRSVALAGLAPSLLSLERRGALTRPRSTLAVSYLHMWANRVFRGSANAQEFMLYDFLQRSYGSELARARPRAEARVQR